MRITIHALIAVLSLAASQSAFDYSLQHASHPGPRRSQRSRDHHFQSYADTSRWLQGGRLTSKQLQTLVWDTKDKGEVAECCPSRVEMVAPVGGTTSDGDYVELYRDTDGQQRFYEVSCEDDVVDKPCLFVDHRLQNQSKCVQKYSFSYALVREPVERHHGADREAAGADGAGADLKWRMDYIKVRSGCSCEIVPRRKRAKAKRRQRDT